jgi:hypothetical protein
MKQVEFNKLIFRFSLHLGTVFLVGNCDNFFYLQIQVPINQIFLVKNEYITRLKNLVFGHYSY